MQRRTADRIVALIVGGVVLAGVLIAWQTARQTAVDGGMGAPMMGSQMPTHGTNPLWFVFAAIALGGLVAVVYLVARDGIGGPTADTPTGSRRDGATSIGPDAGQPTRPNDRSTGQAPSNEDTATHDDEPVTGEAIESDQQVAREAIESDETATRDAPNVLDVLPEDERRVLEPVVASPGITQIELRDRSDFSKSKVSQTVSGLEKRGLLYRERQGRTYRVYPSDELRSQ
ncbi:MAG: helix-turn-helix transcriptional regulator [Halobacteriota archaeon]